MVAVKDAVARHGPESGVIRGARPAAALALERVEECAKPAAEHASLRRGENAVQRGDAAQAERLGRRWTRPRYSGTQGRLGHDGVTSARVG